MRRLTWLLLALLLSGCTSVLGSAGGPQPARPVCFSRTEAAEIMTKIEKLRAAVRACKRGAKYDQTKAQVACQALVARWQVEARTCAEKLEACSARTCPKCALPWILVGVSVAVTVVVGAAWGYREVTR